MSDPESQSRLGPKGIFVTLDELLYQYCPEQAPEDRPHLFKYSLTIHNQSSRRIRILARKWILTYADGQVDVIEGDKVVGKTPDLPPGGCFSYASFHLVPLDAVATGAFHGVDENGDLFTVPLPNMDLLVPGESACN